MIRIFNQEKDTNKIQNAVIRKNSITLSLIDKKKDRNGFIEINFESLEQNLKYVILFSIDGYSPFIINEKYGIHSSDYAAALLFRSSNDDINIFFPISTEIDNEKSCEYSIEEKTLSNFRIKMAEMYPDYKKRQEQLFYHHAFIDVINEKNSLAYIDAQMELLTYILIKLINSHPELVEEIEKFSDIKNAFSETSLMNIKPIEKIINELYTSKNYMRNLQKKYYEIKEQNI